MIRGGCREPVSWGCEKDRNGSAVVSVGKPKSKIAAMAEPRVTHRLRQNKRRTHPISTKEDTFRLYNTHERLSFPLGTSRSDPKRSERSARSFLSGMTGLRRRQQNGRRPLEALLRGGGYNHNRKLATAGPETNVSDQVSERSRSCQLSVPGDRAVYAPVLPPMGSQLRIGGGGAGGHICSQPALSTRRSGPRSLENN